MQPKKTVDYGPIIDYDHCRSCGECYDNCSMDIFSWNEKENAPVVSYPAECSICCFCEVLCPEAAIDVKIPLHHLIDFGISLASMDTDSRFLDEPSS